MARRFAPWWGWGAVLALVTAGPGGTAPAGKGASQVATYPVVFAVDSTLQFQGGPRAAADAAVAEANRLLGPRLGGRFVVATVHPWSAPVGSLEALLDDLRAHAARDPQRILAGLATPLDPRGGGDGFSAYREGLLVIAAPAGRRGAARLFAHEVAHLFGAIHLPDEHGLMAARNPGETLDPLNARIVELNRDRRFSLRLFPLAPEALDAALAIYREVSERVPSAGLFVAEIALERGELAGALRAADQVLQQEPSDIEAQVVRGIALRRLGRVADAVTVYQAVLRQRPGYALVHYNLAIALDHLGETERARDAYERSIALDPRHVSSLSNLARVYARLNQPSRAIEAAQRALTLLPDFTGARVNLAMARLAANDVAAAETEARRAIAEDPGLAEAHEALGAALLAGGRPEAAAEAFRSAAALQPEERRFLAQEAVAQRHLARARQRAQDFDGALAALSRATDLVPDDADLWSERADLAFERGRRAEARQAYERVLSLRPRDAGAHNNLAVLFFRDGDIPSARHHAQEAQRLGLTLHPGFLQALADAERR